MPREGLADKYRVERLGDEDGKHGDCRYFVLDPQHDPIAREAIRVYALSAQDKNLRLSIDLTQWLSQIEGHQDAVADRTPLAAVLDDHSHDYPDSYCKCGVYVGHGMDYHAHLAAVILSSRFISDLMADAQMGALLPFEELFSDGPDGPCRTTFDDDGTECIEVPMADLRDTFDRASRLQYRRKP